MVQRGETGPGEGMRNKYQLTTYNVSLGGGGVGGGGVGGGGGAYVTAQRDQTWWGNEK